MDTFAIRYQQFRQACLSRRSLLIFILGFIIGKIAPFSSSKNPQYAISVLILIPALFFIWSIGLGTCDSDPDQFCLSVINPTDGTAEFCGDVNTVIISPISPLKIISGSSDHSIRVLDPAGNLLTSFPKIESAIKCLALSKSGLLISGNGNGYCDIWDLDKVTRQKTFNGHQETILSVYVTESYCETANPVVVSCSTNGTAIIWDLHTLEIIETFNVDRRVDHGSWKAAASAVITGDAVAVFGNQNGNIYWCNITKAHRRVFEGHFGAISALAIYNYGGVSAPLIVSASADWTVRVWSGQNTIAVCASAGGQALRQQQPSTKNHSLLRTLEGHSGPVEALALFYGSNPLIISSGRDSTVRVWDLATGQLYQTLESDAANLLAIAVTQCPNWKESLRHTWCGGTQRPFIISCESDATIRFWNLDRILRDIKWKRRKGLAFIAAHYKLYSTRRHSSPSDNKTSNQKLSTRTAFLTPFSWHISNTKYIDGKSADLETTSKVRKGNLDAAMGSILLSPSDAVIKVLLNEDLVCVIASYL